MVARLGRFRSDKVRERFHGLYDRVMEEEWPVPYEDVDVETGYGTTRVHRCGTESGVPLVLVHGHAGTSIGWSPIVGRLAARRELLVVDVVGALGRSVQTRPIEEPGDLATWFDDLLDGLGVERAHVVGFSEGGFVAFHLALGAADRVASLVAIDAAGTIERVSAGFLASMAWAGLKTAVGVPGALQEFGQRMTPGVELSDTWWEMATVGNRGFRHALPMPRRLTDDQLRALEVPTLLVMAADTEVYDATAAADRARRVLPAAEVEVVEGAGHGLVFTHADRVWPDVLDFCDRHEPAATS